MKRYSIHWISETACELRCTEDDKVSVLGTFENGTGVEADKLAAVLLGTLIKDSAIAALAAGDSAEGDGDSGVLLPEGWESVDGICFSEKLPGGRDFTQCEWSWRDPQATVSPLLLMSEESEYGHLGAELAGFTTEFSLSGGTVAARGRFYNSEVGVAARDRLVACEEEGIAGYGVSVGPTENLEVEYREECVKEDADGFCESWDFSVMFTKYEIGSVTMCTPAGFEGASIRLVRAPASAKVAATPKIAASLDIPVAPPRAWFEVPEPKIGEPFMGTVGDEFLVEQEDGNVACPVQFLDNGQWFGHLARWGDCHEGYERVGMCVQPPTSPTKYAHFHVGSVTCDGGSTLAVGALTIGCDHAPQLDCAGATDFYANSGLHVGDMRVVDGEYGPWACGALRPDLTAEQLRLLRALVPSGDWAQGSQGLDLAGVLMVNTPGYPVAREVEVIRASAGLTLGKPVSVKASGRAGVVVKLVAAGIVRRCPDCERRRAEASLNRPDVPDWARALMAKVDKIEGRTRHLTRAEAEDRRSRLTAT